MDFLRSKRVMTISPTRCHFDLEHQIEHAAKFKYKCKLQNFRNKLVTGGRGGSPESMTRCIAHHFQKFGGGGQS